MNKHTLPYDLHTIIKSNVLTVPLKPVNTNVFNAIGDNTSINRRLLATQQSIKHSQLIKEGTK